MVRKDMLTLTDVCYSLPRANQFLATGCKCAPSSFDTKGISTYPLLDSDTQHEHEGSNK